MRAISRYSDVLTIDEDEDELEVFDKDEGLRLRAFGEGVPMPELED